MTQRPGVLSPAYKEVGKQKDWQHPFPDSSGNCDSAVLRGSTLIRKNLPENEMCIYSFQGGVEENFISLSWNIFVCERLWGKAF